jgi:hypothetical protein
LRISTNACAVVCRMSAMRARNADCSSASPGGSTVHYIKPGAVVAHGRASSTAEQV